MSLCFQKRHAFFVLFLLIQFLLVSCASSPPGKRNSEDSSGFAIFTVYSEYAGEFYDGKRRKTSGSSDSFLERKSRIYKAFPYSSDLYFGGEGKAPNFKVRITKKEETFRIPLRQGVYHLVKVGQNYYWKDEYTFEIEEGKVNYIGDIYIDLILFTDGFFFRNDIYSYSVKDEFETYRDEYGNCFDGYEADGKNGGTKNALVNKCVPTENPVKPGVLPL